MPHTAPPNCCTVPVHYSGRRKTETGAQYQGTCLQSHSSRCQFAEPFWQKSGSVETPRRKDVGTRKQVHIHGQAGGKPFRRKEKSKFGVEDMEVEEEQ